MNIIHLTIIKVLHMKATVAIDVWKSVQCRVGMLPEEAWVGLGKAPLLYFLFPNHPSTLGELEQGTEERKAD